jgi:hypothetical protein
MGVFFKNESETWFFLLAIYPKWIGCGRQENIHVLLKLPIHVKNDISGNNAVNVLNLLNLAILLFLLF